MQKHRFQTAFYRMPPMQKSGADGMKEKRESRRLILEGGVKRLQPYIDAIIGIAAPFRIEALLLQ